MFIVSKSGGLIYHHDHNPTTQEVEKTFGFPLDIKLHLDPQRVSVVFGQRDGIAVGHSLLAVNGIPLTPGNPKLLEDGREVMTVIETKENYPLNLKFGRHKTTTNEKIVLASMFYPLYALAVQLSPEQGSSGIEELETDT